MSKVYRVRKLTKAQADSIEEITFGNKETAAGQVAVKYLNEETIATLQVGYDTLRGMLCAGAEIKGDLYVTYDQRLVMDLVGKSCDDTTSSMQERIYKDGKTVKANKDFDVLKDGGRLAGHWMNVDLKNVADSDIYVNRKGELMNDDSSAYIYAELQKINGTYGKEKVTKAHVNELMQSASTKSAELLMPVMGDTIGAIIRRDITLTTFVEYLINKVGDDIVPYFESFRDDIIEEMKKDKHLPSMQEAYLKKGEIPSYKRRTELAEMIAEEKDIIKTVGMELDENPPVPKNFIDIMYITELIDNVKEDKESLSTALFLGYVFDTDRVVAGARLAHAIGETLLADISWTDGDIGPAISTVVDTPENVVREFLDFLADNGVEDTSAMYNQYFHNGKTFGQDFLERLKNKESGKSNLEQIFHAKGRGGNKKEGSKFKKNNSDEFTSALSKLGKKENKFNKGKGESKMRITSNGFGKKNKNEDIKEYTLDGTVYYVDFSDIREFDGVEAAIVYDENEEVIGAMAENGEAIDTDGNAVGKMKEKSSGFGSSKKSSGFGSSKSSGFGSSKKSSGFGSSKSSGFGSKSKGVPCMVPDDDTVYYVTDNEVEAFDIAVLEIVNKAGDVVGGVTEDGELMDLKGNNIGDIILEDDEEEKSSGFGSKKKSGFGSSKSSGFGSSKKSSFGSSKSSGFGSSKKSSGFGSSKSSGFGNNLKDNPGASSLRSKLKSMK